MTSAKLAGVPIALAFAPASSAGSIAGCRARNSGKVSGFTAASVSRTNSSGLSVGNRGDVWPSRSVEVPSASRNFTAMPRTSGFRSGTEALPPPLDQRTSTGVGCRRGDPPGRAPWPPA